MNPRDSLTGVLLVLTAASAYKYHTLIRICGKRLGKVGRVAARSNMAVIVKLW